MSPAPGALDRLGRAVPAGVEETGKIILLFISGLSGMVMALHGYHGFRI
jgi:hypothetical protein